MSNETIFDFIVVGSGPSGAISAKTLVDAKAKVLLLDVGYHDDKYQYMVPAKNYEEIRQTVTDQHRFFLGDKMEAIPKTGVKVGAQLSPSRKAMIKNIEKLIPLSSNDFTPMESLGYGGLGAGWGLGAYVYSPEECNRAGLDYNEMKDAYQYVTDHIGVSAANDDIRKYVLGETKNIQESLQADNASLKMFDKYNRHKKFFAKNNMYFGAPAMAIITKEIADRKATSYEDMDFYTDNSKSAYRPQFTIDTLKTKSNFKYIDGQLIISFKETDSIVEVQSIDIATNSKRTFYCKKLILASGALGTARIVMRSQTSINRLPLLSNPYAYLPGIQWSMLGKKLSTRKTSMAQAMMIYDENGRNDDLVSLAFYTYQSLMLFRLIKESPLNFADNRIIFQYLQSAFVIAGIHHPDIHSEHKYLSLEKSDNSITGDMLNAKYKLSEAENSTIKSRERKLRQAIQKLGIQPIKRINPGAGSSIHYGGTVPFSQKEKLGYQNNDGKLYGTKNIYIADSSGFTFLPAKGVTLSIMANAHRVCKSLVN